MVCEDGAEKERVNTDHAERQRAQRREKGKTRTLKTAGCGTRPYKCDSVE